MMIPYYVYGALLMSTRWMMSGFDLYNLKWQIVDLCSLRGIGATWFLPCLFFAQLIYWGIKKSVFILKLRNTKMNDLLNCVSSLVIMGIPFMEKTDNVFITVLFRAMISVGFIMIGDLSFKRIRRIEKSKTIL